MTTNVHGCWFAPEGAVPAARIAFSISSRGTGSSEKWRTDRRSATRARNSRERRSASSSESRSKLRGAGVYVLLVSFATAESVACRLEVTSGSGVRRAALVLEAAVDGERHDHRVGAEALREPVRTDDVRAGRDAPEDSLLARKAKGHLERRVVLDRLHVIDFRGIPERHDEPCPAL